MADISGGLRSPGFRNEIALLVAAVVLFVIAMLGVLFSQTAVKRGNQWQTQTLDWRQSAAAIAAQGSAVAGGAKPDFRQISQQVAVADRSLAVLSGGNAEVAGYALPGALRPQLDEAASQWTRVKSQAQAIAAAQPAIDGSVEAVNSVADIASQALTRYERVAERLASRDAPSAQILLVAGQMTRLERITNLARDVAAGPATRTEASRQLESEVQTFVRSNDLLLGEGADGLPSLMRDAQADGLMRATGEDFAAAVSAVSRLRANDADLVRVAEAASALPKSVAGLDSALASLDSSLAARATGGGLRGILVFGAGIAAALLFIAFMYHSYRNAQQRQAFSEDRDNRQQGAILNLLDEITNLADGDLTVDVTVTEDFTGAIADSINYTVDTLRRLVGTINNTSVEIAAAATSTQDTAQKMNQASERQAREITNVTTVITQTAESLTQVASRAEQIAQDAANSVEVAHNGAVTVGRTINGMTAVREQIQETAKRIKRLGESSQEIGNIIEFINDIAEQTNTLALNASIQAAMAGEAGRGFAVVADEVQRLAERAGSATRQIETLVKTIQADTTEAIISMERSTGTVVSGARSAEEAGQALTRIETTSTEVARLIQDIASAARSQSAQATRIAGQMQAIREIAVQTSGSSGQTARAVGELTNLSEKLRESVAGFKLPSDVSLMTSIDLSNVA